MRSGFEVAARRQIEDSNTAERLLLWRELASAHESIEDLVAAQIPAGGETVSMKPRPAMTRALMRDVKFAVSKYSAVFIASGLSGGQFG
jgi:hypothetical protein